MRIKIFIVLVLVTASLLALCSCSDDGGETETTQYATDTEEREKLSLISEKDLLSILSVFGIEVTEAAKAEVIAYIKHIDSSTEDSFEYSSYDFLAIKFELDEFINRYYGNTTTVVNGEEIEYLSYLSDIEMMEIVNADGVRSVDGSSYANSADFIRRVIRAIEEDREYRDFASGWDYTPLVEDLRIIVFKYYGEDKITVNGKEYYRLSLLPYDELCAYLESKGLVKLYNNVDHYRDDIRKLEADIDYLPQTNDQDWIDNINQLRAIVKEYYGY